jgi:hypothetical protein
MALTRNPPPTEDEEWRRKWTFPYEDRLMLTSGPWHGERRWFRSPNVIALETYRSGEDWERIRKVMWPRQW